MPKLGLVLDCTKFGAAPHAGVRIAAARGQLHQFSRLQPYAVFKRCGAPEFAKWAGLIFLLAKRMAAGGQLASGSPDVPLYLPIARFAG